MTLGSGLICSGGTISVPAIGGQTWLGAYGAKCDGVTDDTSTIQTAWDAAAGANQDLLLSGVGIGICKFSSITAPTPTNGEFGNRSALIGAADGSTELLSTVTGSSCAITYSATYGVNSDFNINNRDFMLVGQGSTVGKGICLTSVTKMAFQNVWFTNFDFDIYAVDSIRINLIRPTFQNSTYGAWANIASNSNPNAWVFIDPNVWNITNYGIFFYNPTQVNIIGGDYEGNGIGNAYASSIYIEGNPIDGTSGLNLTGGYFSSNFGQADITIDNVSQAYNGVHTINGAEFQRISSSIYVASNIALENTGSGITTLNIKGNGFQGFNTYSPSSSRPYITESAPTSTNYTITSGGNWFQSSTEYPGGAWWDELGWASYTPTLSCASGSLTTASATGSYKRLTAKTISVEIAATVTNIGSCATALLASLPTTANSAEEGTIRNTSTNVSGSISTVGASPTATMISATGTLPVANGQVVNASIVYESQ